MRPTSVPMVEKSADQQPTRCRSASGWQHQLRSVRIRVPLSITPPHRRPGATQSPRRAFSATAASSRNGLHKYVRCAAGDHGHENQLEQIGAGAPRRQRRYQQGAAPEDAPVSGVFTLGRCRMPKNQHRHEQNHGGKRGTEVVDADARLGLKVGSELSRVGPPLGSVWKKIKSPSES